MKWTYDPKLVPMARALRNQSTPGEVALWNHLKNGQVHGIDFHRQKPLDRFILDFFAPNLALAIELDGGSHLEKESADWQRDEALRKLGITVLRFREFDARRDTESVVQTIRNWVEEQLAARPSPLPGGVDKADAPRGGVASRQGATHSGERLGRTSGPSDKEDGVCPPLVGIALGSNLGDRGEELRRAFDFLCGMDPALRVSRIYESTPVDCPPGSGLFLNAVAVMQVAGEPAALLDRLQEYEIERGRAVVRPVNAPRPIDLDILCWGDRVLRTPRLVLPHPRMHERLFVLLPLQELVPDFRLPGDGRSLQHFIDAARARPGAETCLPIE